MATNFKNSKGAFAQSLLRTGSKIKEDRAQAIFNSAERVYRRKVEDLEAKMEDLDAARASQLDMSPNDINSLVLAENFDAEKFYETDLKTTLEIRECKIRLEEARARYETLFGVRTAEATA